MSTGWSELKRLQSQIHQFCLFHFFLILFEYIFLDLFPALHSIVIRLFFPANLANVHPRSLL